MKIKALRYVYKSYRAMGASVLVATHSVLLLAFDEKELLDELTILGYSQKDAA